MRAQPKSNTDHDDQKVFSVRIDPILIRKLKVHAVLVDRSIRSVVTEAFDEYLSNHKNEAQKL